MISFTRSAHLARNIDLYNAYWLAHGGRPAADARNALFQNLIQHQPFPFPFRPDRAEPLIEFDVEPMREMLAMFAETPLPHDSIEIAPGERAAIRRDVLRALEFLAAYEPDAGGLLRSVVGCIAVAALGGHGGASVGAQVGIICICPAARWTLDDYAEAILHESVHQAQFLDQMINGWFVLELDEVTKQGVHITSPLLRRQRPFSTSFEAACVGITLLELHERRERSARALDTAVGLLGTLAKLREKKAYLTAHGSALLDEMDRALLGSAVVRGLRGAAR